MKSVLPEIESGAPTGVVRPVEITPMACDHSSLDSVRTFSSDLHHMLGDQKLDVVCLNAAMVADSAGPHFADGIELTFLTNHLSPFLLVNLLHDVVQPKTGRIVITSSGLHNGPTFDDFKGCLTSSADDTPLLVKEEFSMINSTDYHPREAYSLSKLCNTTTCLSASRKIRGGISVNCFTPGFIPTTELFRNVNAWIRPVFTFVMSSILGIASSVEWGGGALAWMAVSDEAAKATGQVWVTPRGSMTPSYGDAFHIGEFPAEATSQANQDTLWKLSSQLTGISDQYMEK